MASLKAFINASQLSATKCLTVKPQVTLAREPLDLLRPIRRNPPA